MTILSMADARPAVKGPTNEKVKAAVLAACKLDRLVRKAFDAAREAEAALRLYEDDVIDVGWNSEEAMDAEKALADAAFLSTVLSRFMATFDLGTLPLTSTTEGGAL